MKISRSDFKYRTRNSFLVGSLFAALVVSGFAWVNFGPDANGAPKFLRRIFSVNEKVFRSFYSDRRASVAKTPPPIGKMPRANGEVGLDDEVTAQGYEINVQGDGLSRSFRLDDILKLPKVSSTTDFRCIEGWSEILNYQGARFSEFMDRFALGRRPDGTLYEYVGLETPDGEYYVSIDMASMRHPQTVLTYEMNGAALSPENGFPLRLIIPVKYGIKNLKRIGKIVFSDQKPHDYWEERGYDWYSGL
ncbi:MAG: molybdopterin-dependent oxidoreductase [Cryobacterium sp.]|nr:molybdopterin-dependent oxidoreductase [Oligoflexia bacterium]